MGIVAAAILFTALAACSIGPGLLLLPWMHVDDDEKSVVVVGVSLLAVFLAAFGIYLARLPVGCGWAVTAACVACIGFRWSTLLRLLAHPVVRVQLAGLALVLGHSLLLQASIRNYNGLFWVGDWYEHFERTVFFIEKPDPVAARFLSDIWGPSASYMLTARPPFMNVLTAHAIAHGTPSFAAFQLASTWLNALACLPAVAGHWRRPGGGVQLSTSFGFRYNNAALERADDGHCRRGRASARALAARAACLAHLPHARGLLPAPRGRPPA
jgi:hypothetical protein